MAAIAPTSEIAAKWARVTPLRTDDYTRGIENPRVDWSTATLAANANWKSAIAAAASQDLFAKGVRKAGTAKWQQQTLAKGPPRWTAGIALGEGAYETGFAPFRDAIERVKLPERFPRRDPRNLARVKAIVDALIAVKLGETR